MGALRFLLIVLVALAVGCGSDDSAPAAPRTAEAVPSEWTGSESCSACHKTIYRNWEKSTHASAIRPFAEDSVARPFDGEIFGARGIDHRMGPGGEMHCEGPGGAMQTFPVEQVVGVRRVQMYLTSMDRGRIQVLPVFCEVPKKKWFDYADFVFGRPRGEGIPPDSPNSWYTYARNFNSRCGRCHTTEFKIGYEPDGGRYASSWTETVIGCEACHGPGRAHVTKWRRLEDGPDEILNAGRLGTARSNQACGYCHAEGEMVRPGFRPGDDLFDFVDVHGLEDERHVAADGRAHELIHNFLPILQSACGPLACTHCHDPHGHEGAGDLYKQLEDDSLCTSCHRAIAVDLVAHTHHKAAGKGSRCIACHMPRLVIEGGHGRVFDHTISIPSMENTKRFGLPNACRACHLTEDTGWEYESFDRFWPGAEKRNHRVGLAETIKAGRTGDPQAKAPLLSMLEEQNPVYRAAAGWLLSKYDADLRPLLDDADPMVRRSAIKGLAQQHPEALVPLLDDAGPVLQRAAALALAENYAYLRTREGVRERLVAVLAEFSRLRPDHAVLHFRLAALHEMAGRGAEAVRAYQRYLVLRPWDQRTAAHLDRLKQ